MFSLMYQGNTRCVCLAGKYYHEMNENFNLGSAVLEHSWQLVCQWNGGGHRSWAGQSGGCGTRFHWVRALCRGGGQPTLSSRDALTEAPQPQHVQPDSSSYSRILVLVQCSQPRGSCPSPIQSCQPESGSRSCLLPLPSPAGIIC